MDENTGRVVGKKYVHRDHAEAMLANPDGAGMVTDLVFYNDLDQPTRDRIEKGERCQCDVMERRYRTALMLNSNQAAMIRDAETGLDALKEVTDALAAALEDSNREVLGDENTDIWLAGVEALECYRELAT